MPYRATILKYHSYPTCSHACNVHSCATSPSPVIIVALLRSFIVPHSSAFTADNRGLSTLIIIVVYRSCWHGRTVIVLHFGCTLQHTTGVIERLYKGVVEHCRCSMALPYMADFKRLVAALLATGRIMMSHVE